MRVYLAGEREAEDRVGQPLPWTQHVRRRLYSYYYHGHITGGVPSGDLRFVYKQGVDLFLDSGAFTGFTKGVDLSVDSYAAYIHEHGHMFTCISSLDDTHKNEKLSYDNLKALESLGCKVQPVFHTREDPRWLVKYIDEGYDYIFIGGMVPETTQWLMQWLDDLFHRYLTNSDGTPRVKLHGFGLTDQRLMFRYPWYSVDSTSWLMTGIFGACVFLTDNGLRKVVFSEDSPQAKKYNGWHYYRLTLPQRKQVDEWLEQYGVTAEECARHYSYRDAVNAAVFQDMERLGATRFVKQQQGLFDA